MEITNKTLSYALGGVFIFGAFGFYSIFLLDTLKSVRGTEYHRATQEQNETYQVKCKDPMKEYDEKLETYTSKYKLVFPKYAFDVLDRTINDDNASQFKEAQNLKLEKELVEGLCKEAEEEKKEIKPASDWAYFKAHWKELVL